MAPLPTPRSLDYKEEYDQAAAELSKATEISMNQHNRRKGVNGEIKQYKEMKKEADRYRALSSEKVRSTSSCADWWRFRN